MILTIFAAILLVVFGYAGILSWAYFQQSRSQYSPTHRDSAGAGNSRFRPWRDSGGDFLGYRRATANRAPRKIVLFFHGNKGEALDREWLDELVPTSDLLILAEYPGYGARAGIATERSILESAEKIVDQIRADMSSVPIVAVGESLGSAVAGYLGSRGKVDKLALISSFSSIADLARIRFPFLPVNMLVRDRFELERYAENANVPMTSIHGTLDEIFPLELARRVVNRYRSQEKKLIEIPGFGHQNLDSAILHSPFAIEFRNFIEH